MSSQLSFMAIAHDDRPQDWGLIERTIKQLNPPTVGVMLSLKKAVELSHQIDGTVLYSRWHGDGPFWASFPAQHYVELMKSWKQEGFHDGMVVDAFRENVGHDLDAFLRYNVDLARLATSAGIRVALGGFSTGGYEPHDVINGRFDAFIRAWCEGNHVLSVHEYTAFGAHTGLGTMPNEFVTERFNSNDPTLRWGRDPQHNFYDGQYFRNHPSLWTNPEEQLNGFLYRRCTVFHDRAVSLGLEPGEIIITEANIAEQIDSYNHARSILERDIGVGMREDGQNPYLTLRGPFTMKTVWENWWGKNPGWRWDEAFIHQLRHLDKIYQHARFKLNGYHLFVLEGVWSDWDVKYGFDFIRYPELLEQVVSTFASATTVSTVSKPTPINFKTVKTKTAWLTCREHLNFANIRNAPSVSAQDIGDIYRTPLQVTVMDPPHTINNDDDGYTWLEFWLNEQQQYAAMEVINLRETPTLTRRRQRFDMVDYLFANPNKTFKLQNSWSGMEEIVWSLVEGKRIRKLKNGNWEGFYITDDYICRDIDTSPGWLNGRDRFYVVKQADGTVGVPWVPRSMAIGETFVSRSHVQFYYKDNGEFSPDHSGSLSVRIELKAHHERITLKNQVVLEDVLEVWGYLGNGPDVTEKWFCSREYGYFVQWEEAQKGLVSYFAGEVSEANRHQPEWIEPYSRFFNWNPMGAQHISPMLVR